ncbi:hypothetical protein ACFWPK_33380 [Nocardia sp. NPDC058519]|uniref:hypothetical protein n=1 Tax=Nocardia sp. NPDC058519 TaxID=3346535 RepID=UPI00365B4E2C
MTIPRYELTPEQAQRMRDAIASAEMLDPPIVSSAEQQGLVLDIAAVGITATGDSYLRCADKGYLRVPEALAGWAILCIGEHQDLVKAGNEGLFPARVEFGVFDGRMYAERLDN